MIVGVLARDDAGAARLVERLAQFSPTSSLASSVSLGVAIATFGGPSSLDARFEGDRAYVGTPRAPVAKDLELRGDFAMVSRQGDRLRLARGRFSGRALHWARVDGAIVACSRLEPLAALLRGRLKLQMAHIAGLFHGPTWAYEHPLPFVGVESVHLNTIVELDRYGSREDSRGPIRLDPELRGSTRELAGRLREEFRAAVARQCGGARVAAVFASGGIDSSNLLAASAHNAKAIGGAAPVPVSFYHGGPGDDRPHFDALCRGLGLDPLRVAADEGVAFAGRERVLDACAHAAGPSSSWFAAVHRAKKAGAELGLVGTASELLLDADPTVFLEYLAQSPLRALACAGRFRGTEESRLGAMRRLLGPSARRVLPDWLLAARRQVSTPAMVDWAGPRLRAVYAGHRRRPPWHERARSQRERIRDLASSDLLTATVGETGRLEIASGFRIQHAYLDDDFVRFVARLPSSAIFAGAWERGLLRESMIGQVPETLRTRRDKGKPFGGHEELFDAMGGYDAVRELVDMRELATLGFVEPRAFRRDFERFAESPSADTAGWGRLWGAIGGETFLRWFKEFNGQASTTTSPPVTDAVPS